MRWDKFGFLSTVPCRIYRNLIKNFRHVWNSLRKGKSFYLRIMGKACIVNDPEEVNGLVNVSEDIKSKAMSQLVLVKVKIQSAEYVENTAFETNGLPYAIRSLFNKWFGSQPSGYRPYSFQPAN